MPGTVTVGSRLPHGLRLQLQEVFKAPEPVLGGGSRDVNVHRFQGDVVILNGFSKTPALGGEHRIENGFALTPNVDADFFAKWMDQNKDLEAVKKGLIFASAKHADVIDHTRAGRDELSGLEPTDPTNLPAEFQRTIKAA